MIQQLPANTAGRDFVTGDIHGCFSRLRALLDMAKFDESKDRLLTVGDLVDRGPESLDALEWLDYPWFFSTAGNHEQMAINFAAGHNHAFLYERNGGRWFINLEAEEQQRIARRFQELPLAIEVPVGDKRVGLVHAEVPGEDWARLAKPGKTGREVALWARTWIQHGNPIEVAGIDYVLVGHTPINDAPQALGNVIYIDSGAVFNRPMILQCLTTDEAWIEGERR